MQSICNYQYSSSMEEPPLFTFDNGGYDHYQQQQQQQQQQRNPPTEEEKKVMKKKTSGGKKKIEKMELIADKAKRQVTFSKRRKGLFKKAEELSSMFGAQVAVVVFSEAGKTFAFDHQAAIQRFLNSTNYNYQEIDNYDDQEEDIINNGFWWEDVQVDRLDLNQLEYFKVSLKGFRDQIASRLQQTSFH